MQLKEFIHCYGKKIFFSPKGATFEADNFAELVGHIYAEVFYYEQPRIIFSGDNYCEIDAYVVNAGADSSS